MFLLGAMTEGLRAAPDARFGFVGTGGKAFAAKFGLPYYTLEGNYPATGTLFSSVDPANDPPAGFKVVREVAKLNVRNDGLGQTNAQFQTSLQNYGTALATWYYLHAGAKPQFTWYAPNAAALAAAESLQIVTTIRREKTLTPAVTGTVWEIGNEPNLFPALLPTDYADIFSRYYRIIKREDSTAKVAFGSIFIRETAGDLKPRAHELLQQQLISGGALTLLGQARFDSLLADVENTLFSRLFNLGTVDYVSQCFAAMNSSVRPDFITLHVYPYDDRAPALTKANIQTQVDSLVGAIGSVLSGRGFSAPVWITEFGNINPSLTEATVASQTSDLIDIFEANSGIGNRFYYKATGADQQFALLPGIGAPLTRLATDSSFNPPDGNFSCTQLNTIGLTYYLRAVGAACQDVVTPAAPTLINPVQNATEVPISITLTWIVSSGATSYRVQLSTDSTFATTLINDSIVTTTSRAVGTLANNTAYYWRVTARNSAGTSAYSTRRTFTTTVAVPSAPILSSPANNATGLPITDTLKWAASTGAATYRIQLSTDSNFAATLVNDSTITGTFRVVTGLLYNTVYYWRVNAKNSAGTSAFSVKRGFATIAAPPAVPTLNSPPSPCGCEIVSNLVWNASLGAISYRVQVSTDSTFATTVINDSNLTATTRAISGLSAYTWYYWRVSASNSGGTSAYSAIWRFNMAPLAISSQEFMLQHLSLVNGQSLRFGLPERTRVSIQIFNTQGRMVSQLLDETRDAGYYTVQLPAGLQGSYNVLDFRAGKFYKTMKIRP